MKKFTKIVATLGPTSDDIETIKNLYKEGMNVARLNFSHGSYEYFSKLIKNIRNVSEDIAILLDTKGPEIRTGEIKGDIVELKDNQKLILTKKEIIGDDKKVHLNYKHLDKLEKGNKILIDDGLIETSVLEVEKDHVLVKVINGGKLGSKKTVSIWGHSVKIPFLSKKDKEDILFGIKNNVDFIAASFVRNANEVKELKKLLEENNREDINIISKIEHSESVNNIDEIIKFSNGIMIARGDLAVEVPPEKVPGIQGLIIKKCRELGKPVIVATQMLESMKDNPRPTRAEVADVARAVMQGTDAVMLSGETAGGKYPQKAVKMMTKIANEYDLCDKEEIIESHHSEEELKKNSISMYITKSAYLATKQLKIKSLLIPTVSGFTARNVSRFRPRTPILALTHNKTVLRQLQLSWGVKPVLVDKYYENKKDMLNMLKKHVKEIGFARNDNDMVVITSGHIFNSSGHTSLLDIFRLKNM